MSAARAVSRDRVIDHLESVAQLALAMRDRLETGGESEWHLDALEECVDAMGGDVKILERAIEARRT